MMNKIPLDIISFCLFVFYALIVRDLNSYSLMGIIFSVVVYYLKNYVPTQKEKKDVAQLDALKKEITELRNAIARISIAVGFKIPEGSVKS